MDKYNLIIDSDYYSLSMHKSDDGVWVKASDIKKLTDQNKYLINALVNLRDCNVDDNSIGDLNDYVNFVLRSTKI